MNKLLLAADPEMFTKDSNNNISSVAGKLGCDKWNKLKAQEGVNLQEDNVLVEFDIAPCESFAGFNKLLKAGIDHSSKIIKPHGLEIAEGVSSHIFTEAEIASFDPSVLEFGCVPDYNGLTGIVNPRPSAVDPGLRSAGGHIHFGYDKLLEVTQQTQAQMTIMCDLFLGMTSLLMDNDTRRRKLYGQAGSVRFKDYGIEYRTLSNFWIFKEAQRRWAFDQAHKAFNALKNEEQFFELVAMVNPMEVQRIINEDDKAMAEAYIKMTGVM